MIICTLSLTISSCAGSCKNTSTYTSNTNNRMIYGHSDEGVFMPISKTPYATAKAKKPKAAYNGYATHWWDKL